MTTTLATAEQAVLDAVPKQLFIGGAWRDGAGGATVAVEDPATGETIAAVADGTVDDALDALTAEIAAAARAAGAIGIDAAPALKEAGAPSFLTDGHLSAAGHDAMARAVAAALAGAG